MKALLACGGTAGHIFPALALLEQLKKEEGQNKIILVLSTHPRDKLYLAAIDQQILQGVSIETVGAIGLSGGSLWQWIAFSCKLGAAMLKSLWIVLRYQPDIAVGFGGYACFAPLACAHMMGRPTLIHEQNVQLGKANRLLAYFANCIATSFANQTAFPRLRANQRIVQTGLPLRRQIINYNTASLNNSRDKQKFTILVFGGSQGAHHLNELMLACLSQMEQNKRAGLKIIHLTGKKDFNYINSRYQALGIDCEVFEFLGEMARVYAVADLLIARAGASTIFEAAHFALPCIFMPYSYASRHQKENALYLQNKDAAIALDEEKTKPLDLAKALFRLIDDQGLRQRLSQNIQKLDNPQAAQQLKDELLALAKGN